MSDVQEPKRAWTEGPWEWTNAYTKGMFLRAAELAGEYEVVVGPERDEEIWTTPADAALIALAPELAEFVLEHAPDSDLAVRLRRIGGEDD